MSALLLGVVMAVAPCQPHAELRGDPALVRMVENTLRTNEVEVRGESSCPPLRVLMEQRRNEIRLEIEEPTGRKVSRTVQDAGLLVPLIESRLRTDLAEPFLLLPHSLVDNQSHGDPDTEETALPIPAIEELKSTALSSRVSSAPRVEMSAHLEVGVAEGGVSEIGAALVAALPHRTIEPTITLRGTASERFETQGLSAASSQAGELLVGARMRFPVGPVSFLPAIGIGVGLDVISRERCVACGPFLEDDAWVGKAGLRTEASLGAIVLLSESFALKAALSAGATPFASGEPTLPSWVPAHRGETAYMALPAAPRYRTRVSVGMGWRGF